MIAMALVNDPKLLIADEPTTALDVTVQAQILALMERLQRELGMAIVIITHDLGVVAEMADDIAVMYAGRIVETAVAPAPVRRPRAPLHLGPAAVDPAVAATATRDGAELVPIPGTPPSLINPPVGLPLPPALPLLAARPHTRSTRGSSRCRRAPATRSPACSTRQARAAALWAAAAPGTRRRRRGDRRGRAPGRRRRSAAVSRAPLIEVRDLVKHFPITRGILIQRKVGAVRAVDGVELRGQRGETLGHRRRDRLRQEHDRRG